ncbi:acyl carrier protein [Rhodococcus fascians]|nr:acyl carrier protein [Rhodococcus fascians]MBY4058108.1 acyl carrier protein [Rhodococcus fascians]MBY4069751.1 acyl carrier protein [Rhodococcus fascians]
MRPGSSETKNRVENSTMADALELRIRKLIGRMAPNGTEPVDSQRLVQDLGFDSIRLMELTVALEHAFLLPRLDPQQWVDVLSVGDVVAIVQREMTQAVSGNE